jgi:hypothetical protein
MPPGSSLKSAPVTFSIVRVSSWTAWIQLRETEVIPDDELRMINMPPIRMYSAALCANYCMCLPAVPRCCLEALSDNVKPRKTTQHLNLQFHMLCQPVGVVGSVRFCEG